MIPVFVGAAMAASAIYGLYKGGKAVSDHKDANVANADANQLISRGTKLLDDQRKKTNAVLEDYGARKLRSFNGAIKDFVEAFGKLKNVDSVSSPELEKLVDGDFSVVSLDGLRRDYQLLMDSGLGVGAGLGSGAALAFGAYNGTFLLASASTGTAISTLSGAAATNATLAWLGGGALSAGGFGMAGGTMVLGGLVAGPALAIFGLVVGAKADAALSTAKRNKEVARTHYDEAVLAAERLAAVQVITTLANKTFSKLGMPLRRGVADIRAAIAAHGQDFSTYPLETREKIFRAVKIAQLIKLMVDTPILDKDGALVLSTEKTVRDVDGVLAQLQEQAAPAAA
ncbi:MULTISPECIES: hypothetical protein [Stenotrophomonas]|jgi:hypothetical protein|uniref:hypothetical protein n=1 Tax=Stenotrophomonas TaxID=40323 RepID=UPI000456A2EE|nr:MULTISPECIES: hypothetical protein [Stenotrophomonas]AHY60517.1 hypothetical protein DX03_17900 [Stenotrophomonas rhizophila]QHB69919.1 hypothetical protein GQ674_00575 [Stenotrophomonas sp. 364]